MADDFLRAAQQLVERIAMLERLLLDAQQDVRHLQRVRDEAFRERDELRLEVESLLGERDTLAQKADKLRAERAELRDVVHSLRESRDVVGAELRKLRDENADLNATVKKAWRARDIALGEVKRLSRLLNPPPVEISQ